MEAMDRYEAAMVLGALGNAMGFHNMSQESNKSGLGLEESDLSDEVDAMVVKSIQWKVSFDTLMHLATAEALASGRDSLKTFYSQAAKRYLLALDAHQNRLANSPAPARGSVQMATRNSRARGYTPLSKQEPMFGAAARTMCIGMRFSKPQQLNDLLQASIECGRMTHSFPTAFLGNFCTALFASYAIQGKPVAQWGWRMMEVMPIAEQYCENKIAHFSDYRENWFCFETIWQFYLKLRGIQKDGCDVPLFPKSYKIKEQHKLYRGWRSESSGKQKGLEATLIAYDALLVAGRDWKKLCNSAMFHWGESDVTGAIAGCLYGILYGFDSVPSSLYLNLEFKEELEQLGRSLYCIANPERSLELDADQTRAIDVQKVAKRFVNKRTVDEINNLLNYMALIRRNTSSDESICLTILSTAINAYANGKMPEPKGKIRPSRFQLVQSKFTKIGLRSQFEKLQFDEPQEKVPLKKCTNTKIVGDISLTPQSPTEPGGLTNVIQTLPAPTLPDSTTPTNCPPVDGGEVDLATEHPNGVNEPTALCPAVLQQPISQAGNPTSTQKANAAAAHLLQTPRAKDKYIEPSRTDSNTTQDGLTDKSLLQGCQIEDAQIVLSQTAGEADGYMVWNSHTEDGDIVRYPQNGSKCEVQVHLPLDSTNDTKNMCSQIAGNTIVHTEEYSQTGDKVGVWALRDSLTEDKEIVYSTSETDVHVLKESQTDVCILKDAQTLVHLLKDSQTELNFLPGSEAGVCTLTGSEAGVRILTGSEAKDKDIAVSQQIAQQLVTEVLYPATHLPAGDLRKGNPIRKPAQTNQNVSGGRIPGVHQEFAVEEPDPRNSPGVPKITSDASSAQSSQALAPSVQHVPKAALTGDISEAVARLIDPPHIGCHFVEGVEGSFPISVQSSTEATNTAEPSRGTSGERVTASRPSCPKSLTRPQNKFKQIPRKTEPGIDWKTQQPQGNESEEYQQEGFHCSLPQSQNLQDSATRQPVDREEQIPLVVRAIVADHSARLETERAGVTELSKSPPWKYKAYSYADPSVVQQATYRIVVRGAEIVRLPPL